MTADQVTLEQAVDELWEFSIDFGNSGLSPRTICDDLKLVLNEFDRLRADPGEFEDWWEIHKDIVRGDERVAATIRNLTWAAWELGTHRAKP